MSHRVDPETAGQKNSVSGKQTLAIQMLPSTTHIYTIGNIQPMFTASKGNRNVDFTALMFKQFKQFR